MIYILAHKPAGTSREDGRVIIHDSRADNRQSLAQRTIQENAELTGVQFHPETPDMFVTSAGSGMVCLRDARMAFGPRSQRSNGGIVQTVRIFPLLDSLSRLTPASDEYSCPSLSLL
jgi:hypothetical protein